MPKFRRITKHLKDQWSEIDYYRKLSPDEKEYLNQFMLEFYQADFNFDHPIHPDKYRKECATRNNAAKRQWHSVGTDLKLLAQAKQIELSKRIKERAKPYTIEDYQNSYDFAKREDEQWAEELSDDFED